MSELPQLDVSLRVAEPYVMPGGVCVAANPTRCTTILGSCVAICLFDLDAGVGGMNHFLLAGVPPVGDSDPLRWSNESCAQLLARMIAAGASKGRLQVKVFGGASVGMRRSHDSLRIGEKNVQAAEDILRRWGITPLAVDTGGDVGRKLIFETHTGKAWVRALGQKTV